MGGLALLGAGWCWLLPLAGLPIIFHFAYRQRRKQLAMPSLLFFQRLEPRLQARKRLRDILVLLLRALAVLFVVLALARPLWQGIGGGGQAAIVIVIDNSASMGAPAAGSAATSRLRSALDGAGALIANLASRDRAGIVLTVPDALVAALPELTSDRARLRAVLDQIHETDATGAPAAVLARAAALLAADSASRREVHIFSDLQEHEWGVAAPGAGPELPSGTVLCVHRIPVGEVAMNAALADLRLSDRACLAGRPTQLRAALTNAGTAEAAVTVSLLDDNGRRQSRQATVPAKGRLDLPLAAPPAAPGRHWARVWIEGDRFAGDNDGYVAFTCADKRTVAVIGARADYGVLPLALAPVADGSLSGLVIATVEPAKLIETIATGPVLIAITTEACAALDVPGQAALRVYVEKGGRLLVAPRAVAPAKATDAAAVPGWLGAVPLPLVRAAGGTPLMVLDPASPVWRDVIGADGAVRLGRMRAFVAAPLRMQAPAKGILGFEDGRPILSACPIGAGTAYVSGLAFTPAWSTLPLSPAFLAIAQAIALPAATEDGGVRLVAGEAPLMAAGAGGVAQARAITGAAMEWRGPLVAGRLPVFPRVGVYAVSAADREVVASVRCAPDEGLPGVVGGAVVPALGTLRHAVEEYRGADGLVASFKHGRTGIDLMPWFLVAALAALFAEGWLANRTLIRAPRPAHRARDLGAAA